MGKLTLDQNYEIKKIIMSVCAKVWQDLEKDKGLSQRETFEYKRLVEAIEKLLLSEFSLDKV